VHPREETCVPPTGDVQEYDRGRHLRQHDLPAAQERGYLLSRVRIEMLTALDRELEADRRLAPLELSAAQFIIIANLAAAEGPMSASDLCKGISYDAGAMTRMLDRLESKGLIRRHRSATTVG